MRTVVQQINVAELSRAIPIEKDKGAKASMAAILAKQRGGSSKSSTDGRRQAKEDGTRRGELSCRAASERFERLR